MCGCSGCIQCADVFVRLCVSPVICVCAIGRRVWLFKAGVIHDRLVGSGRRVFVCPRGCVCVRCCRWAHMCVCLISSRA